MFSLTLTSPALAGDADGGIEVGTPVRGFPLLSGRSVTIVALPAPGGPGFPSFYISEFLTEQQLSFGLEFSFAAALRCLDPTSWGKVSSGTKPIMAPKTSMPQDPA